MIIEKISITKFHVFKDVEFELGTHLTVIAGQNGTQKTTILGLLSQPFVLVQRDLEFWTMFVSQYSKYRSAHIAHFEQWVFKA